jgi:uncharacterized protein YfiM (DUF2279 family)
MSSVFLFLYLGCLNHTKGQDSLIYNNLEIQRFHNPETFLTLFGISEVIGYTYLIDNYRPDGQWITFHLLNDRASFLQMDKLHHIFGSYYVSYWGFQYLLSCDIRRNKALFLSAPLGFLALTPKEFIDGHRQEAGFSWRDVTCNLAGPLFLVGQELLFNEQIVKYKFSFSRSEYFTEANGLLGNSMVQSYFRDYNSHTYWLSFNANRLIMKNKLPNWINIAAGYSANGMFGSFENKNFHNGVKLPETQRYRQFLLSLDVDWPEIKTRSKFLEKVLNAMVFIKLPFPAVEFNSKGQLKGYWLYF